MKNLLYIMVLSIFFVSEITYAQSNSKQETITKDTVSENDLGEFPYFKAPESYKFAATKTKQFEEKYFFDDAKNANIIEGKYFHATIFAQEGVEFNETFVVNFYKNLISKFGGKLVYSGGLPNKAYTMIEKENPAYVKDLYDAVPYNYKQFFIRTKEANIWIELIHGLNAYQIDFTVMREEMKE